MKTSKTVIQRIAAAALALAMMITAVTGDVVSVAASTATAETQVDKNGAANEAVAMNTYEETENSTEESASTEKAVSTDEEKAATDSELTEEEQKWQNKLMAKVDNFLYVRAKADGES
jgi:pyruvoyl-dependent arginine decarboxylase (PvlArgDC)